MLTGMFCIISFYAKLNVEGLSLKKKFFVLLTVLVISCSCGYCEEQAKTAEPVHTLESIDVQKIIRYSTKSSLEFTRRGLYYEEQGDFQTALKDYTRALELTPNRSELLIKRAKCYDELKQYNDAIYDLTEVISMRPYRAEIYAMRGKIYNKIEQRALAEWDFNKAVELNPLKPDFYVDRGDFYSSWQKSDYAKRDYIAAAELYAYTAQNFKKYKKWQDAINEYEKAIERNPENAEFKRLKRECEEALEAELRAIEEEAAAKAAEKAKKNKKGKLPKEEFQR